VTDEIRRSKGTTIELLIPDLKGDESALRTILNSHPEVIGHNLETVEDLQHEVRDRRASYDLSLRVLEYLGEMDETVYTKSSLMLGLGETRREVMETMGDLLEAGVDFLTLGQYMRPLGGELEVKEWVPPSEFERYRQTALEMGFRFVASGPFVRSSYRAGEALESVGGEGSC
jgi:lipoic acid synthetase